MARKPVLGDVWSMSSLERAMYVGEDVYKRARSRQINWPPVKKRFCPEEETCSNISLDEAFDSVMSCLHLAARQCRKYHANTDQVKGLADSALHCRRYHTVPQPAHNTCSGNPLQSGDRIHLVLPQGGYAVTAHRPDTGATRTKITQVSKDGYQTLTFSL